jgi:hypothetical protein
MLKYQISLKSIQWVPRWSVNRQTDKVADKHDEALRDIAIAPKQHTVSRKQNSFFTSGAATNADHGLLILEVSRSHSDASRLVELLWTSDQPVAGTST